jgi:hypothetical protein
MLCFLVSQLLIVFLYFGRVLAIKKTKLKLAPLLFFWLISVVWIGLNQCYEKCC